MKKIFIILIWVLLVSPINALSIPTVIQDGTVELTQFCPSCTFVNLSSVIFPDNTIQYFNEEMTKNGSTYNFSFSKTSQIGEYVYFVEGDKDGTLAGESLPLIVTKTGFLLTEGEAIIYLVVALGVFLLFVIAFYFMLATPYSNKIDEETGAVIQLTKLKYVKLGFIMLTWVLLTWLLNILVALSDNLVNLSLFFGFFGFMFGLMTRLALPFGIIIIVIGLFEIIRDANLYKRIQELGGTLK